MIRGIAVIAPATAVGTLPLRQKPSANSALPPGQIWTIDRGAIQPAAAVPGCYIWHISSRGQRLARYVGVAETSVYDRIRTYWIDMTPQLIERHPVRGMRAHTTKNLPRQERKDLRWVHLWLAWAALAKDASVELEIIPSGTGRNPRQQEQRLIGTAPPREIVSLNKEHLPAGQACLCTAYPFAHTWSTAPTLDTSGRRYLQHPVPPDWPAAKSDWMRAIDLYISERRLAGLPCR